MASPAQRQTFIAPTAIIDPTAQIGSGSKVWAFCQIGERAIIGKDCVIGNGAYIDRHVRIGNRVRIQNKALLYHGLVVENDVFIGPGAVFTNDPRPRSGKIRNLKGISWTIHQGASIGANSTVLPDVDIGAHAMVGAGSVVTKNVLPYTLVYGNPARLKGHLCSCGELVKSVKEIQCKKIRCSKCKSASARGTKKKAR